MKNSLAFIIALALTGLAQAQTNLVANPAFAPSGAKVPAGYLPAITGWNGTGTKSVGIDVFDAEGGLWLSQARSVSTGSLSTVGWTNPKASYVTQVPATCTQQTVTARFYFRGQDPYVPSSSGLRIGFGNACADIPWRVSPDLQTVSFTTNQPAGGVAGYVATLKGLFQANGVHAGVEVIDFQVTCP